MKRDAGGLAGKVRLSHRVPTGRPTYKFRDPRIPKTFPGCWKNAEWRKRYDQVTMRILREGPYGKEERERLRARRKSRRATRDTVNNCLGCGRPTTRLVVRNIDIDGRIVSA
jgi:hypothetical protein